MACMNKQNTIIAPVINLITGSMCVKKTIHHNNATTIYHTHIYVEKMTVPLQTYTCVLKNIAYVF